MKKVKFTRVIGQPQMITSDGLIDIDLATNTSEVSDELADELVANNLAVFVGELAEDPKEPVVGTDALMKELMKMTVAELQQEAANSALPEEEWKTLNKGQLVKYLVEKSA